MIELMAVNIMGKYYYFKKCCGNCKHADHLPNRKNMFQCTCMQRFKVYPAMYNNIRILSQSACRYFEFVPNYEYKPDARLHNKDESNFKIDYSYKSNNMPPKIEKAADVDVSDKVLLEAAKLLKSNCQNKRCGQCGFFIKGNMCKLMTKRDFNFNTVPRDWDV